MSFLLFCRILWARRWIVIGSTLGCFIAAMAVALILPARYEAKSRVMMDIIKPDPVTGQVMSTSFARAYTVTQTELIRDYRVSGHVVDDLGWTTSPVFLAQYNAAGGVNQNIDFRRWLAQQVANSTKADPVENSNILEISYTASNPETARLVADAIRKAYVDQSVAFKREAAGASADWFDRQLAELRGQLATAEQRKTAFERANNVVLQDDDTDTESARLKALTMQTPGAETRIIAGNAAQVASPAALQLAQLDAKIESEARVLGPNHPEILSLRQQRAGLASAAAQERRGTGGGTTSAGPSIAGEVAAQQSRVIAQRDKVEEARRLSADVKILRDQYSKTAQRAADLRQQAESNESGLTLLGSAVSPQSPKFPNMPLTIAGSLICGLGLGLLSALVTELLSRRVRSVEDLAKSGAPVIMVFGGAEGVKKPPLLRRLGLGKLEAV